MNASLFSALLMGLFSLPIQAQEQAVLEIALHPAIKVSGTAGSVYAIESKTELPGAAWVKRVELKLTEPTMTWFDPEPAETGRRFYRAVKLSHVPVMAWIEPGAFVLGSPDHESGRNANEGPQTQVTLTQGFWLGRYEVTQAEFMAVVRGTNPSRWKGDDLPVEGVGWRGAVAYCEQLTQQERDAGRLPEGWEYRLPTEAQWEYACRAGSATRFSFGVSDADLDHYAWYRENSGDRTHPVGQKRPNAWGLYDMHGNVYEWCGDWSSNYPGGSVTDPMGPVSGEYVVLRNGCWDNSAADCRSARRREWNTSGGSSRVGFRVALVPVP